jgi:hypothetical protein
MNAFKGEMCVKGKVRQVRACRSGQDLAAQDDPAGVVQDIRVGYRVFVEYDQVSGGAVG